jgi:DNA helicase II / ATP-dependent DNA helicase PcrA
MSWPSRRSPGNAPADSRGRRACLPTASRGLEENRGRRAAGRRPAGRSADGASIITFTFTEQATADLKARISAQVEERLGTAALDMLGAAFAGTIHAYCFRLLQ